VLDRLVDMEPDVSREPVQRRLLNMAQIKASVIRDLENLLNTRRSIIIPPIEYREMHHSLFIYGIKDFSSENPKNPRTKRELRREIEQIILQFEPRLKNVIVRLENPRENERALRFRISGLLVVEPLSEPVTFDTFFDVNRGEYIISN